MPVAGRNDAGRSTRATVERVSDTTLVWRHTLRAKAVVVYDAYTKPELVKRWWAPRSRGLEMVRARRICGWVALMSTRSLVGGRWW